MIRMKFSKFMTQKYNTRGELHELYVLKGEGKVLYVGISKANIWWRWFGAPSSHLYWDADDKLGNYIHVSPDASFVAKTLQPKIGHLQPLTNLSG